MTGSARQVHLVDDLSDFRIGDIFRHVILMHRGLMLPHGFQHMLLNLMVSRLSMYSRSKIDYSQLA